MTRFGVQPRNVPAPERKFDHGMTWAEMAKQEMARPENQMLRCNFIPNEDRGLGPRETRRGYLMEQTLACLTRTPQTCRQISDQTGVSREKTSDALVNLRRKGKAKCHKAQISTWTLP